MENSSINFIFKLKDADKIFKAEIEEYNTLEAEIEKLMQQIEELGMKSGALVHQVTKKLPEHYFEHEIKGASGRYNTLKKVFLTPN